MKKYIIGFILGGDNMRYVWSGYTTIDSNV